MYTNCILSHSPLPCLSFSPPPVSLPLKLQSLFPYSLLFTFLPSLLFLPSLSHYLSNSFLNFFSCYTLSPSLTHSLLEFLCFLLFPCLILYFSLSFHSFFICSFFHFFSSSFHLFFLLLFSRSISISPSPFSFWLTSLSLFLLRSLTASLLPHVILRPPLKPHPMLRSLKPVCVRVEGSKAYLSNNNKKIYIIINKITLFDKARNVALSLSLVLLKMTLFTWYDGYHTGLEWITSLALTQSCWHISIT